MKNLLIIVAVMLTTNLFGQTYLKIEKKIGETDSIALSNIQRIYFSGSPTSLLASWPLDEGTGTIANDISGNGYHGTLSSGVTWAVGGLNLNGGNNAVSFIDSVFRMNEGSWQVTINAVSGQNGWIICKDNFGYMDDGILWLESNGNVWFDIHVNSTSSTQSITSTSTIPYGVDVTLTAEWGSNGMKLFINETLVGTNPYTGPIISVGRPLMLGQDIGNPTGYNGIIKDVKVYNTYIK